MSDMIGALEREHEALKRMMKIVDRLCRRLKRREDVDPEHLERIQEFFEVFADQCHHQKEETALFPVMKEAGIPVEGGPMGVLLTEHKMMRGCIERMGKAIARYKKGDQNAVSLIVQNAINHNELLTMHMSKEDHTFFPMADAQLSDEQKKKVAENYEALLSEKVEPGKIETFYQLIDQLDADYLDK